MQLLRYAEQLVKLGSVLNATLGCMVPGHQQDDTRCVLIHIHHFRFIVYIHNTLFSYDRHSVLFITDTELVNGRLKILHEVRRDWTTTGIHRELTVLMYCSTKSK